ncbi:hypothetical protein OG711_12985 [Streptomyces uncialis]|uniref:hypothetical protein n=1 Tax=Streptomyces uncialis TaxID=1048205 RepID=UPI002E2F0FF7|nr:hypothetical protein [Streptomyces uncialis]
MSRHTRPGPPQYLAFASLVLWCAWTWQSSAATARGIPLTEQLTDHTPLWWYALLAALAVAASYVIRTPVLATRPLERLLSPTTPLPAALTTTVLALLLPPLLLGVPLGSLASDAPLSTRWDGYADVVTSPVTLALCAAACATVTLIRRRAGRGVTAGG